MATKKHMATIVVTRDSVCAGDDINPPHEQVLAFDADAGIGDILTTILDMPYLVAIQGGRATWSVHADGAEQPLAVVAQQWDRPRLMSEYTNEPLQARDLKTLHFRYHVQQDPWFTVEQFIVLGDQVLDTDQPQKPNRTKEAKESKLKRPTNARGRFEDGA